MKKLLLVVLVVLVTAMIAGCAGLPSADGERKYEQDDDQGNGQVEAQNTIQNQEQTNEGESVDFGSFGAKYATDLSYEEMLRYAIQDEYLARQEYESIMKTFGDVRPFSNIIRAEEAHISMLKEIYQVYRFDTPADTAIDHVVIPNSIEEAIQVGVIAEINNIAMYDAFLKADLPDDIRDTFVALREASVKHQAAFERGSSRGNGGNRQGSGR